MLEADVKVGTSTPKTDPSGDYAFEVFRKAEAIKSGAQAALEKKALKLTGAPNSPQPPPGRSLYGRLIAEGKADLFLTYCTGALAVQKENSGRQAVNSRSRRSRQIWPCFPGIVPTASTLVAMRHR
jgi:ABC-type molybdate transport system substrate-binding protein